MIFWFTALVKWNPFDVQTKFEFSGVLTLESLLTWFWQQSIKCRKSDEVRRSPPQRAPPHREGAPAMTTRLSPRLARRLWPFLNVPKKMQSDEVVSVSKRGSRWATPWPTRPSPPPLDSKRQYKQTGLPSSQVSADQFPTYPTFDPWFDLVRLDSSLTSLTLSYVTIIWKSLAKCLSTTTHSIVFNTTYFRLIFQHLWGGGRKCSYRKIEFLSFGTEFWNFSK